MTAIGNTHYNVAAHNDDKRKGLQEGACMAMIPAAQPSIFIPGANGLLTDTQKTQSVFS